MSFSILSKVTKNKVIAPRKILLHGVEGVGKTTFACSAPKPFLVATEPGSNAFEVPKLPSIVTDWFIPPAEEERAFQSGCIGFVNVLRSLAQAIKKKQVDYKTIAIDSVDWLERIVWHAVCGTDKWTVEKARQEGVNIESKSIEDFGFGKGYNFAAEKFAQLVDMLDFFTGNGVQIIMIAHTAVTTFQDPQHDSYDRYQPKLHKKAAAILKEWCDEIFFATWRTYITKTEEGFNKERTRASGSGERVMFTEERPAYVAKNRIPGLPHELPLNWAKYSAFAYGNGEKVSDSKSAEREAEETEQPATQAADTGAGLTIDVTADSAGNDQQSGDQSGASDGLPGKPQPGPNDPGYKPEGFEGEHVAVDENGNPKPA